MLKIKRSLSAMTAVIIFISALTFPVSCSRENLFPSPIEGFKGEKYTSELSEIYSIPKVTPSIKVEDHLISDGSRFTLTSPDGYLSFVLEPDEKDGGLTYSVTLGDRNSDKIETWIRPSALGVTLDGVKYCRQCTVDNVTASAIERNVPLNGIKRYVEDRSVEAIFTLEQNGYSYYLDVRAYNNGVAFRYRLPSNGKKRQIGNELTTFSLPKNTKEAWCCVNNMAYEAVATSIYPMESSDNIISAPLTAVTDDGKYISVSEGNTTDSYCGIHLRALGECTYSAAFYKEPTSEKLKKQNSYYAYNAEFNAVPCVDGDIITGWRTIALARDLNELVNNDIIYCVNDTPDSDLFTSTEWITPGKSTWSWCVKHSAPTYEQMLEYTRCAAELGFEYNIIDDGWPTWDDSEEKLETLGSLAESSNVRQILWCALGRGTAGSNKIPDETSFDKFLDLLERTHIKGAKVDFWQSEVNPYTAELQKYMLEEAAKRQLVIDFHGCPKNVGWNVTYPNELTREGIRGFEFLGYSDNNKYTKYTQYLNRELYTRFLCGHADWTPATYNAMQIGSLICIDSPLMVVSTDASSILNSPAVEFIKSIPTVWDRTVVLPPSEINQCSIFAKQHEGTWFIGGLSSDDKTINIDLSQILDKNNIYLADLPRYGATKMDKSSSVIPRQSPAGMCCSSAHSPPVRGLPFV